MVLVKGIKTNNMWKSFALNALATALATIFGIEAKYIIEKNVKAKKWPEIVKALIAFLAMFIIAFLAFTLMHFAFGFGKKMVV